MTIQNTTKWSNSTLPSLNTSVCPELFRVTVLFFKTGGWISFSLVHFTGLQAGHSSSGRAGRSGQHSIKNLINGPALTVQ